MGYREVTMIEVKEVLRLWLSGSGKKRVARLLSLDPKTVRRYIKAAEKCGLRRERGEKALTDELVESVMVSLRAPGDRTRGESWSLCVLHRDEIRALLDKRVRLTKIRKLLARKGIVVPY